MPEAVHNITSDVLTGYLQDKRIRSINLRSSVLSTVVNVDMTCVADNPGTDNQSSIRLCLLPVTASLRSVRIDAIKDNGSASSLDLTEWIPELTLYSVSHTPARIREKKEGEADAGNEGYIAQVLEPAAKEVFANKIATIHTAMKIPSGIQWDSTAKVDIVSNYSFNLAKILGKSIYELCCDTNGEPTAAFAPYKSDKHLMLAINWSGGNHAKASAADKDITTVTIDYVDGANSYSQLTKLTVD